MQIRVQTEADYPGLVALVNELYDEGLTVEEYARQQAARQANPPFVVLVAEVDGRVVGRAAGGVDSELPEGDMLCSVLVAPGMRGQGVGSALLTGLHGFYREHEPQRLRATIADEPPAVLAWAERRGFQPTYHILESRLDLASFDPGPLFGRVTEAEKRGTRFLPFSALRSPESETRLWKLYSEIRADTPDGAEWRETPRDEWLKWAFQEPVAWPDGWLVAVDGAGNWVGLTFMQRYVDDSGDAHIYMTGITREHRGQGLSTALKMAAACRAKEQGIAGLTTINEENNAPILAVNRRMGFVKTDGYYRLVCPWGRSR